MTARTTFLLTTIVPLMQKSCPLYPRKQTCAVQLRMSALGQKRTHAAQQKRRNTLSMSAAS
jgi:hypothetical protein